MAFVLYEKRKYIHVSEMAWLDIVGWIGSECSLYNVLYKNYKTHDRGMKRIWKQIYVGEEIH